LQNHRPFVPVDAIRIRPETRSTLKSILIALALDTVLKILLKNGADVDLDCLVRAAQCRGEIGKVLAVVDDRLAQQLEGKDACLAVWLLLDSLEDEGLIHIGSDVDNVVTWLENQVWNRKGTNFHVSDKIPEGDVSLEVR
jgi:hypothetical protein